MFLFDTDHLGIIQRQTEPEFSRLWTRIDQHPPTAFSTSIVSFHEQLLGWNSYLNRARDTAGVIRAYAMFERILKDFASAQVAGFDQAAASLFDAMRVMRIRIPTLDLRIASIALSKNFTLLTRNMSHFRKVPGLKAEDWTG
jgi:tRNA(fMet)-specific endonuclease VapC